MKNQVKENRCSEQTKLWIIIVSMLLVAITITSLSIGLISNRTTEKEPMKLQEMDIGNSGYATEFVNTERVKLFSASAMTYSRTTATATKKIYAQVYPATAENRNVTWSIKWENEKSEAVTNYVTVSPDAQNQTYADVTCYAPFEGNIVITVTTEEGGYTADCVVTFVGVPVEIAIETNAKNDGTNYTLGLSGTYAFNLHAVNPFNQLGEDYRTLEVNLWCLGNLTVGTYDYDHVDKTWSWEDEQNVFLNDMLDKFVTVEYSNGVATIKTGDKQIDEYYEKYTNIDGGRTRYYSNKVKEVSEDLTIGLTIKEPTSGLVKVIYLKLDKTVVADVSVTDNLLF